EELDAQRREPLRQPAIEVLQRAAPLCRGAGVDQIARRFGLQQVELAVQERAARELTGLGRAGTRQDKGGDARGGNEEPAVRRDLHQILARERARPGKARRQDLIERLAAGGVDEARAARRAGRRREEWAEATGRDVERPRAGKTEQRQRGTAGRGGRSEEHTSELQSRGHLVCRLLLEKKKKSQ